MCRRLSFETLVDARGGQCRFCKLVSAGMTLSA